MILENNEFPSSIAVETTNYCNLNCNICGQRYLKRKKGFMDVTTYKKIINEVAERNKNTKIWLEFFGEPLLLKYKICYYIFYAKKMGLKNVFLNTNGILLDKDISEALIDVGLDKIVVSLDAYYEETYRKIRNNENFNKVVNNIIDFIDIKEKLEDDVEIEIQMIPFPEIHSSEEIKLFTKKWSMLGAKVKIKNYISWHGAVNVDQQRNRKRYPCGWLFNSLAITWDGNIVQCSCDYNGENIIGNIYKSSVEHIWNNEIKEIRLLHLKGEYDKTPICLECKDWDSYIYE